MINNRKTTVLFIVLIGIVSLFSDMVYEGARSITGPFLEILHANAFVVSFFAGLGELLGYALRLASGYLADKTKVQYFIILAPAITGTEEDVDILAQLPGIDPPVYVAVRQGPLMATAFHPELTDDLRWHAFFVKLVEEHRAAANRAADPKAALGGR